MAAPFYVLPTTDIHLVNNASLVGGKSFSLNILDYSEQQIDIDKISFSDFNSSIVSVAKNISTKKIILTAQSPGHTIGRILLTDNGMEQECFVSVWVHQDISRFWAGPNQITIHTGAF